MLDYSFVQSGILTNFYNMKMEYTIQYLRFHLPAKMSGFPSHLCLTEWTLNHSCACFVEALLLCRLSLQCNIFYIARQGQ